MWTLHNLQISSGIVNKIADLQEQGTEDRETVGSVLLLLRPPALVFLPLMERELNLRIVLESPPAGVDYALQKGRGSDYATIQTQRSKGRDLHFEFTVRAKVTGKDTAPNFLGPFVQGPTGERFVYIDIGSYAGQTGTCWSRRLKIPLRGISWQMIEGLTGAESVLETHVAGASKDGSPAVQPQSLSWDGD